MIVVQQIQYTERPESWWELAEALGFTATFPPAVEWAEFDGDGVLAFHGPIPTRETGATDLHLLVDDLDAAENALDFASVSRDTTEGVGEMLTVFLDGVFFGISQGARPTPGGTGVQPILFQPDIAPARRVLEAIGLRAGIASDRGGWVELHGDAGSIGLHEGDPRVGLSFQARGDLDALQAAAEAEGFDATIVDEAFARTLRILNPDGGDEVWVNGEQDDLHGYHRED